MLVLPPKVVHTPHAKRRPHSPTTYIQPAPPPAPVLSAKRAGRAYYTPLKDSIIRLLITADEQSMNLIYNFAQNLSKSKPAET